MENAQTVVMSTRGTPAQRGRVRAIADADGISVSELIHRLVMPQVDERLRRDLAAADESDGRQST